MKKFIMSKVDTAGSPPLPINNAMSSPDAAAEEEAVAIHPPLPVDPPLSPKKEVEDIDNVGEAEGEPVLPVDIQTIKIEENKPPKPTICRDFIRGTCSRIGTCRYNHDMDLSQLQNVYTFCHNFQNKSCTHPKCKYVHATIPEQETFYRTGFLPPHTLAHNRVAAAAASAAASAASALMPPPPPPMPQPAAHSIAAPNIEDGTQLKAISINVKSPSSLLQNGDKITVPAANCIPVASVLPLVPNGNDFKNNLDNLDDLHDELQDDEDDTSEDEPCTTCDVKENRLEHAKDKFDELLEKASATTRKTSHVEEKQKRVQLISKTLTFLPTEQQQQLDINILQMVSLLNNLNARHG